MVLTNSKFQELFFGIRKRQRVQGVGVPSVGSPSFACLTGIYPHLGQARVYAFRFKVSSCLIHFGNYGMIWALPAQRAIYEYMKDIQLLLSGGSTLSMVFLLESFYGESACKSKQPCVELPNAHVYCAGYLERKQRINLTLGGFCRRGGPDIDHYTLRSLLEGITQRGPS